VSRQKKPLLPPLSPQEPPGSLRALLRAYLLANLARGYSELTVKSQRGVLEALLRWCSERGVLHASEVSRAVLESYQRWLYLRRRGQDQRPLTVGSQYTKLKIVQGFFRWLLRQGVLLYDPAACLELPHLGRSLPSGVLDALQVERLLSQPELASPLGLRDRAMMEVLYSTGMRRFELCGLELYDLRPREGTVFIRQGKGRKDRVVPIGERALFWVERYLREVRGVLVADPAEPVLFVAHWGGRLEPSSLTHLVRRYLDQAGIKRRGACHLLRHAMATELLKGGASIRHIQEMLGHADLSSTQLYTHVSIEELRRVHGAAHPAASLRAGASEPRPASGPDAACGAELAELLAELEAQEPEHGGEDGEAL
jgi:integrase/recombinase XerD